MNKNSSSGFTLVELAIVLMIIGLLIGGILRGQELMNNARLQNISKQITSYSAAVTTFQDAYSAYPGDLANAISRLPGCETGNTNGCRNGNGNGIIGNLGLVYILGDQTIASENTQFWKHLALIHLLTGINPSASELEFGISHPSVPTGGGLTVATSQKNPGDPTGTTFDGALVLRLHGDLISTVTETNPAVSPQQASYIDRKMDDGVPNTGDVQTTGAPGMTSPQEDCEVVYSSADAKSCVMAFVINR